MHSPTKGSGTCSREGNLPPRVPTCAAGVCTVEVEQSQASVEPSEPPRCHAWCMLGAMAFITFRASADLTWACNAHIDTHGTWCDSHGKGSKRGGLAYRAGILTVSRVCEDHFSRLSCPTHSSASAQACRRRRAVCHILFGFSIFYGRGYM